MTQCISKYTYENAGTVMNDFIGQSNTARLAGSSKQTGRTNCHLFATLQEQPVHQFF